MLEDLQIGLFWILDDDTILSTLIRQDQSYAGHKNYWLKLIRNNHPITKNTKWDYYLRGRVIHNIDFKTKEIYPFRLSSDLSRLTNDHVKMVLKEFNLDPNIVEVLDNYHYKVK